MFKDLQAGYPVMMLDKSGGVIKYNTGTVISRGEPRFNDQAPPKIGVAQFALDKVIDLTIESEGKTQTFVVPENGNVASSPTFTLSCDAMIISNEVRALLKANEDKIANMDTYKTNVEVCNNILAELNPQYADSREQSQRLDRLESAVAGFDDKLSKILEHISSPPSSPKTSK